MQYGVCGLSAIPMRREPADTAEMVNQVLFGETFEVVEYRKKWSFIKLQHDGYEGWVDNKQIYVLHGRLFPQNRKCSLVPIAGPDRNYI